MQIEYRTRDGHRLEVAANGRVVPASEPINLRSLGCPDWLAQKVENSKVLRRAAVAMGVVPQAPAVVTDADRRAKAAQIGEQIAADARKLQSDTELKNRLQAAAGISHGRR